jgi:hypothetical protein
MREALIEHGPWEGSDLAEPLRPPAEGLPRDRGGLNAAANRTISHGSDARSCSAIWLAQKKRGLIHRFGLGASRNGQRPRLVAGQVLIGRDRERDR